MRNTNEYYDMKDQRQPEHDAPFYTSPSDRDDDYNHPLFDFNPYPLVILISACLVLILGIY